MRRLLPLLLIACLSQGCFVLDELDKGQALMDQHSGTARKAKEKEKAAAEAAALESHDEELGVVAKLQDWWKRRNEPKPVERPESDGIVRCATDGRTQFTYESDCLARGGSVL